MVLRGWRQRVAESGGDLVGERRLLGGWVVAAEVDEGGGVAAADEVDCVEVEDGLLVIAGGSDEGPVCDCLLAELWEW
jgi:hypothetical protein